LLWKEVWDTNRRYNKRRPQTRGLKKIGVGRYRERSGQGRKIPKKPKLERNKLRGGGRGKKGTHKMTKKEKERKVAIRVEQEG